MSEINDEQRYFVWRTALPDNTIRNKYFVGLMENITPFDGALIIAKNLYHDEALALKKLMNAGVDDE